jgi:hypothetical protein
MRIVLFVAVAAFVGCTIGENTPPSAVAPLTTDGANQVVVSVPGMT